MNPTWTTRFLRVCFLILLSILAGCATREDASTNALHFTFEGDPVGTLPSGWTQHPLGTGTTLWEAVRTENGQALAQLATPNPNKHFNLAVLEAPLVSNSTLSVRFRAVSGVEDQGGGLVWRYQDKRNHYIVRANPLENNVVLYKMENGARTDLPLVGAGRTYGVKVDPLGHDWHTLELRAWGDLFTVILDGRALFQVCDTTFAEAGRCGLWTKADAVTQFDDFTVRVKGGH